MRDELGESLDHLRMAAAHAADGASGALAPRVDAARKAVRPGLDRARGVAMGGMETAIVVARNRSRQAGRKAEKMGRKGKSKMMRNEAGSSRRWPAMIGGLLVAGAAVGAASAMLRRRRT
jgi:hypothetical protein